MSHNYDMLLVRMLRFVEQRFGARTHSHSPSSVMKFDYDNLLQQMLDLAEQRYGVRTHQRTIRPIRFDDKPKVLCPNHLEIELRLRVDCENNYIRGCFQLAHMTVLLLSPVDYYTITYLEEGLATSFATSYIRDHCGTDWPDSGSERHNEARKLVESFLSSHPDGILRLRKREPIISLIDIELIQELWPEIPSSLAIQLTSPFYTPSKTPIRTAYYRWLFNLHSRRKKSARRD